MTKTMTDSQATDEAVLLLTRKLRRLHPEAYAAIWGKLPEGAQRALLTAEMRADLLRDKGGLPYPANPFDDE